MNIKTRIFNAEIAEDAEVDYLFPLYCGLRVKARQGGDSNNHRFGRLACGRSFDPNMCCGQSERGVLPFPTCECGNLVHTGKK